MDYNKEILMSYYYDDKVVEIDKNSQIKDSTDSHIKQHSLNCFETFAYPTDEYKNSTKKIDISNIPIGTNVSSITDGYQTVYFNSDMQKLYAPNGGWNNWGFPPETESNNTDVLFSNYIKSIDIDLEHPSSIFGFEMEANLYGTFSLTVEFYSGSTFVGEITKDVTTPDGASLFAAKTCCEYLFDHIKIRVPIFVLGFAIAQVRYSAGCNCCCSNAIPVKFEECEDHLEPEIINADLKCEGRLLEVRVKVKACKKRKVAVGVLVYKKDPETLEDKLIRFKVCEACMPNPSTPFPCVYQIFKLCFIFESELCDPLELKLKTIAEYASFNFDC